MTIDAAAITLPATGALSKFTIEHAGNTNGPNAIISLVGPRGGRKVLFIDQTHGYGRVHTLMGGPSNIAGNSRVRVTEDNVLRLVSY